MSKWYKIGGHIWAFNTLGWAGIYLFTGIAIAGILSILCGLTALLYWWRASR